VQAHLVKEAGWHFDPACVEALLSRWEDVEAIYAARSADLAAAA
jgi:response regulator RpfG family c-di-GMP phosphodiesterase